MVSEKRNSLLLILAIYLCTLFIYKDFGVRMILGYIALLIPLVYYFSRNRILRIHKSAFGYIIIVVAVLLAFARPSARFDKDTAAYAICMLICICYSVTANPNQREFEKVERLIWITAGTFAFLVILSRFARDIYLSTIYTFLTEEAKAASHDSIWHGYSCTIAGDDSFHNYIFMLAAVYALGHIIESTKEWKKYYIVALGFIIASFLTGRRGELLVLFVIWVFIGLYVMPKKQRRRLIGIGVVIIAISIPLIPKMLNSLVFSRYSASLAAYRAGGDIFSGRLELWKEAIRVFYEHPLFGVGWGGFSDYVSNSYREIHGAVYNAHNIYLQFLAETGIIGTALIIFGLLYSFFHALKQNTRLKLIGNELNYLKRLNAIAVSIQAYFLLLGMLDPCFMKYYFWCFYSISIIMVTFVDKQILIYRTSNVGTREEYNNGHNNGRSESYLRG